MDQRIRINFLILLYIYFITFVAKCLIVYGFRNLHNNIKTLLCVVLAWDMTWQRKMMVMNIKSKFINSLLISFTHNFTLYSSLIVHIIFTVSFISLSIAYLFRSFYRFLLFFIITDTFRRCHGNL